VVGEIHGLKIHAKSGHVYFELVEKDPALQDAYLAKISCAFFQGAWAAWRRSLRARGFTNFELTGGMEVKLRARVDLFVREGRYQLVVSEVDPAYTVGAIARMRERTVAMLKASGLLERNKALELVPVPLHVGLVTSVGSAAYRDFTSILSQSGYAFSIHVFDAHMQGERTAIEVVRGIETLASLKTLDVIVIVRGGGAKTDLLAFDDISICRAVAACPLPVITGIGHETDLTVTDLVAHRSFVTPTDTARFLVSRLDSVLSYLRDAENRARREASRTLQESWSHLEIARTRLALSARSRLSSLAASLEDLARRLYASAVTISNAETRRVSRLCATLAERARASVRSCAASLDRAALSLSLDARSLSAKARVDLDHRLFLALRDLATNIGRDLGRLDAMEQRLSLMDPVSTLKRGFTITLGRHGKALARAVDVKVSDSIVTVLADGRVHSTVYDKEPREV